MAEVYITDYVTDTDIEGIELADKVSTEHDSDAKVLLVWHEQVNAYFLDQYPKLKGVVRYGVGFDNIDLDEIKQRGLVFCNTPDYGTDEVSDTALTMMLGFLRGVYSYDAYSRNYSDSWQENTIKGLRRLSSLTLGVVGAGRIGTALMRKARAFGMNIFFYDPYKDSGYEKAIGVNRCYDLSEFLAQCDVVSMHTPLTNETSSMVDENFIDKMKRGSILINTSRGEVVKNLDVIYDALESKKISAVALDVLPDEPPIDCKLIKAWRSYDEKFAHKIIINPHTSYYTEDSYNEMRKKAAQNAKRILDEIEPINIIADGRKVG